MELTISFIHKVEEDYMKRSLVVALLLTFMVGVNNGFAQVPAWQMDKDHSYIYFTVDHIFSKVRGQFDTFSADIKFDPQNLAESSFSFEIQVESINTNIAKRDKHLRSADFFNEADFPVIRFQSSSISAVGNDTYAINGKLTIKGKEYDLTLPLTLAGVANHPMVKGAQVAGFNGELSLDRLAYGVGSGKFYEAGVVGKEVDILVSLEALNK